MRRLIDEKLIYKNLIDERFYWWNSVLMRKSINEHTGPQLKS